MTAPVLDWRPDSDRKWLCDEPGCESRWVKRRPNGKWCLRHPVPVAPATPPPPRPAPEPKVRAPKVRAPRPPRPVREPAAPRARAFDVDEAVRRYQAGESVKALAASLGVGKNRLSEVLQAAGVEVGRTREPAPLDEQEVLALYRGGMTIAQMAPYLHVNHSRVRAILDAHGVSVPLGRVPRSEPDMPVVDEEAFVARYRAGESLRELARAFRVGQTRAAAIVKAHGVEVVRGRPAQWDGAELVRRYQAGETVRELADAVHASPQTLRAFLSEQPGVTLRTSSRMTQTRADQAVALYRDGLSLDQIAKQVGGISRESVRQVLLARGVPLRRMNEGGRETPLSAEQEREAAQRYAGGEHLGDLAADLRIGTARLRKLLTDQGVPIRRRGSGARAPGRPIDRDEAIRLYVEQGLSTPEVARALRVKGSRVNEVLREAGVLKVALTARGGPLDVERAVALWEQGVHIQGADGIARQLHVRAARVSAALVEAGFDVRRGRRARAEAA